MYAESISSRDTISGVSNHIKALAVACFSLLTLGAKTREGESSSRWSARTRVGSINIRTLAGCTADLPIYAALMQGCTAPQVAVFHVYYKSNHMLGSDL